MFKLHNKNLKIDPLLVSNPIRENVQTFQSHLFEVRLPSFKPYKGECSNKADLTPEEEEESFKPYKGECSNE